MILPPNFVLMLLVSVNGVRHLRVILNTFPLQCPSPIYHQLSQIFLPKSLSGVCSAVYLCQCPPSPYFHPLLWMPPFPLVFFLAIFCSPDEAKMQICHDPACCPILLPHSKALQQLPIILFKKTNLKLLWGPAQWTHPHHFTPMSSHILLPSAAQPHSCFPSPQPVMTQPPVGLCAVGKPSFFSTPSKLLSSILQMPA